MYNDAFISYRRNIGGAANSSAELIKKSLEDNYDLKIFFDRVSIHNADFWEKIKEGIDDSPNFIMIYTKGYLTRTSEDEDFVFKEISYAHEKDKNIIAVQFDGFDFAEVDWTLVPEDIRSYLQKKNPIPYHSDEPKNSMKKIFDELVDKKGNKLKMVEEAKENIRWYENGMTEKDRLWILTDHAICCDLDWKLLDKAINGEGLFKDRKEVNLFSLKAYDIDTYKEKYDICLKDDISNPEHVISQVYGITYNWLLDDAEKAFGPGHFKDDDYENETLFEKIDNLLEDNGLEYFDVIDCTLVLKDFAKPEKVLTKLRSVLNPNGGIIYVRDLDDDYVDAYPDTEKKIKKLIQLLKLDPGAGNRHFGKKIYNYLKMSGAEDVYISDEIISTATGRGNGDADFRQTLFMTYFSYLEPEFEDLIKPEHKDDSKYDRYQEAYEWIKENYDSIEKGFRSDEFYFRAGYVAGYGIYYKKNSGSSRFNQFIK